MLFLSFALFADTIVNNSFEPIERPYFKEYSDGRVEVREVYDTTTDKPLVYIVNIEYEGVTVRYRRAFQYFVSDFKGTAKSEALAFAEMVNEAHNSINMTDLISELDNTYQDYYTSIPITKEDGKYLFMKYTFVTGNSN